MTAFLLADLGTAKLLYILVGTSLFGAILTWLFRIETTGSASRRSGATPRRRLPPRPSWEHPPDANRRLDLRI